LLLSVNEGGSKNGSKGWISAMKVRCLVSVNLLLGDFFQMYISSCVMSLRLGKWVALLFRGQTFMYYFYEGWKYLWRLEINHVPERELDSKMSACEVRLLMSVTQVATWLTLGIRKKHSKTISGTISSPIRLVKIRLLPLSYIVCPLLTYNQDFVYNPLIFTVLSWLQWKTIKTVFQATVFASEHTHFPCPWPLWNGHEL
jgi:hypothetical protein